MEEEEDTVEEKEVEQQQLENRLQEKLKGATEREPDLDPK